MSLKHFPPNGINGDVCSRDNRAIILGSVIFLKTPVSSYGGFILNSSLNFSVKNDPLQRLRLQRSLIASCQSLERALGVQCGVSHETGDRGYIAKKEKTKSIGWKCSKKRMFPEPINMPLKNLHYATAAQQLLAFHD